MILYVCGPMTGLPEFNYPAFFDAEARLAECGYTVLNPARIDEQHNPEHCIMGWQWYMRHAIRMMLECDGLALLGTWERSRGAKLEKQVASTLEMPCYPVAGWVEMAKHDVEPSASSLSQASRDS